LKFIKNNYFFVTCNNTVIKSSFKLECALISINKAICEDFLVLIFFKFGEKYEKI